MPENKIERQNESLNGIGDFQRSLNDFGALHQSVEQAQQNINANTNNAGTGAPVVTQQEK